MTAPVFGITAGALSLLIVAALYARRHPVWHPIRYFTYEPAHAPGGRPSSPPPAAGPARRDWGESRLPSAAERTAELAAIGEDTQISRPGEPGKNGGQRAGLAGRDLSNCPPSPVAYHAAGERVMPGRADGIPHADRDWDMAPWDEAAQPVTPEPELPPLPPTRYLPAPLAAHAAPDVLCTGRCDPISDTAEQDVLDLLATTYELPPAGMASPETLGSRPGEDRCKSCLTTHLPGEPCILPGDYLDGREDECDTDLPRLPLFDTVTDMRPVPARVAARENAAARFSLHAFVSHTMSRKPPLREYVEATIGVSPAKDWDQLLAQARAGAVSE